jgi:hypothetical protein
MTRVRDWRLDLIYNTSGSSNLNLSLEPWLLDAIVTFEPISDQSLTYTASGSSIEGYFTETLSLTNKIMLSKIMVKSWLQATVNNILQMDNKITDRDFRTFSAAQNLKAKQDYLNSLKEEISQDMIDYSYKRVDWTSWNNQIFAK